MAKAAHADMSRRNLMKAEGAGKTGELLCVRAIREIRGWILGGAAGAGLLRNARPHPFPLPRGEGKATVRSFLCERPSGKSSHSNFSATANDSPSSRGEGRGEGEPNH
jgi:hypothetical protein